jgi:hypothetical protein
MPGLCPTTFAEFTKKKYWAIDIVIPRNRLARAAGEEGAEAGQRAAGIKVRGKTLRGVRLDGGR